MKIAIVVAHSSNRVIGKEGQLPWRLPEDLDRFKRLTVGHAVIMGRKTWDSIPSRFRPLPDRTNVVVSRVMAATDGCLVASSYNEAVKIAGMATPDAERVFVIGGQSIYQMALAEADEIYLTLIEDVVDGDARFPITRPKAWREVEHSDLLFDRESGLEYRFSKLERVWS